VTDAGRTLKSYAVPGRPIRDAHDVPVLASTKRLAHTNLDAWADAIDLRAHAADLDPDTRTILAKAWSEIAAAEHASIAAFAQLALDLLALGAPSDLVDATHEAARDEIRHARTGYAIALAFADATLGPGPLVVPARPAIDLVTLATETFRDGCIGETIAALEMHEASKRAVPELEPVLARIAEDESRHAELAWRIVAWAVCEGGTDVRDAIGAITFAYGEQARPARGGMFGIVDGATLAAVWAHALAVVVVPCRDELLHG